MTDIGKPEPIKETELGKDSTHASDVAKVQEEALVKEEERNDG